MNRQAYNPYLPGWEYIPDGEPHKFGGRVYIYGSHDKAHGGDYCLNDYVCWSAPEENLAGWRYEGVIYRRDQHPDSAHNALFAPDVAQGPDGRYYLYYSADNSSITSVAVCDTPAGKYEYYGDVKTPEGRVHGSDSADWFNFDPAVLADTDGRIWLYSGSGQRFNQKFGHPVVGCFVTELEQDMLTMKSEPRILLPEDESFQRPSFFEGASIRHIGALYYLVYPATDMTGLNYCTSRFPDRDFVYRGRIHSSSDIGYQGRTLLEPHYPIGNNHGGLVEANGQWYVFDHRMTNNTFFSRQGVAEPIEIGPDGTIEMVECTSCGLNGGPLRGSGTYPAYIACVLTTGKPLEIPGSGAENPTDAAMAILRGPCVTQDEPDYVPGESTGPEPLPYIKGLTDGCTAGYKYFDFETPVTLTVTVRGDCRGVLQVQTEENGPTLGALPLTLQSGAWTEYPIPTALSGGKTALYFTFHGEGALDLQSFTFSEKP